VVTIRCEGLCVDRGGERVLGGVDLTVDDGEVLALVGPTGSGKTTLLRAVAGLDPIVAGTLWFDDDDVGGWPSPERNVAFVFQRPALLPHRSVGRNIAFPLEIRHEHVEQIRERVGAEARAFHIEQLLTTRPDRLTAGEAQIVQIARALVKQPAVLLLDEPLAQVDEPRRVEIRRELGLIQRGFGITTLMAVNHPHEAMTMGDRIAVLETGRITQVGSPLEVHDRPRTANAALLTGDADILPVTVEVDELGAWLDQGGFRLRAWQPALRSMVGRRLQLVVRPEWWHVDPTGSIEVTVERAVPLGNVTSLWCRAGDRPLTVTLAGSERAEARGQIRLRLERYVLLDPRTGYLVDL
jgi:ABC-type sugar transport system ATPase subunit